VGVAAEYSGLERRWLEREPEGWTPSSGLFNPVAPSVSMDDLSREGARELRLEYVRFFTYLSGRFSLDGMLRCLRMVVKDPGIQSRIFEECFGVSLARCFMDYLEEGGDKPEPEPEAAPRPAGHGWDPEPFLPLWPGKQGDLKPVRPTAPFPPVRDVEPLGPPFGISRGRKSSPAIGR
jgi:hypothetical protein